MIVLCQIPISTLLCDFPAYAMCGRSMYGKTLVPHRCTGVPSTFVSCKNNGRFRRDKARPDCHGYTRLARVLLRSTTLDSEPDTT